MNLTHFWINRLIWEFLQPFFELNDLVPLWLIALFLLLVGLVILTPIWLIYEIVKCVRRENK